MRFAYKFDLTNTMIQLMNDYETYLNEEYQAICSKIDNSIKYSHGKIYKIVCNKSGKIYVGSTTKSLKERLQKHKDKCRAYLKGKAENVRSIQIIKENDYRMELIKLYPCHSKLELETEELYWIEHLNTVNRCKPAQHKLTKPKEYYSKYRKGNKQHLKEYHKKWIDEQDDEYKLKERIRKRKYEQRPEVKERIRQYVIQYHNRPDVKARKRRIINCDCGYTYQYCKKSRHEKTIRHLSNI